MPAVISLADIHDHLRDHLRDRDFNIRRWVAILDLHPRSHLVKTRLNASSNLLASYLYRHMNHPRVDKDFEVWAALRYLKRAFGGIGGWRLPQYAYEAMTKFYQGRHAHLQEQNADRWANNVEDHKYDIMVALMKRNAMLR